MKRTLIAAWLVFGLIACQAAANDSNDEVKINYFRSVDGRTSVGPDEAVTLEWKALNATECSIQATSNGEAGDFQSVDCEDDATYTPEITTSYRFSASKEQDNTVSEDLTITVAAPEPAETVLLTFNAVDAQDYILEAVEGEADVGEISEKDPVLILSIGKRYRIINRVKNSHPFEFVNRGAAAVEDTVLLSQLEADTEAFTEDPEVNFVKREDGFSFTLTRELAGDLDGYRCAYHPMSMRADVETKP